MKDSKFTKIIKWAKENNYETLDETSEYNHEHRVIIEVGNLKFKIENKESTIYHSIHGMKGKPKGIRLQTQKLGGVNYSRPFSDIYKTQSEVIKEMEYIIEKEVIKEGK